MEKIIHINNTDLFAINKVDELGNSEEMNDFVTTNFQHSLFSSMFMSGAKYIELDKSLLNKSILENKFWEDKFIDSLTPKYFEIINNVNTKLFSHFKLGEEGFLNHPYNIVLSSYITNLFYTSKTGIPCVLSRFKDLEDQEWIKPAVTNDFFQNFIIFHRLFKNESIDSIAPKYSVLKKDVRIFEDMTTSSLYRDYQNSHNELKYLDKIPLIVKDIKVFSLKLYYKYLGNLDLRKTTFSYLKDTKLVNGLYVDIFEQLISDNRKLNFYRFEDADLRLIINKRLSALAENGDVELKDLINNFLIKND